MALKEQRLVPWSIKCFFATIIVSLTLSLPLHAQELTGRVEDESGHGLPGAIIKAMSKNRKLLSYATSGFDGGFSLSLPSLTDTIKVALMGYTEVALIPPFQQDIVIRLSIRPETIQESVVSAAKVMASGDTLHYNVTALKKPEDQMLADILVRIPGIEIDKTGFVKYNGLDINKFYVDGKDILGNSYNLVTRNLPINAIKNIDILEKHQPIRILQGIASSEQAAMNIELLESARGKLNGSIMAGGGIGIEKPPVNTTIKGAAFYLGPAWSSANSGGYDSQGYALRESDYSFSQDRSDLHMPLHEYVRTAVSQAPLEEKRTLFNNSVDISTVDRFSPRLQETMGVTVKLGHDRQKSSLETNTLYLLPEGEHLLQRIEEQNSLTKNASALISYSNNTEKVFIHNNFYTDFSRKEGTNVVSGVIIRQQATSNREWNIENDFTLSVKKDDKVYGIQSFTQFSAGHERLLIQEGLISESLKKSQVFQQLSLVGIGKNLGNVRFSIVPKAQWVSYNVYNSLSGLPEDLTPGSLKEKTNARAIRAGAEGSVIWRHKRFETKVTASVHFSHYKVNELKNNLVLGGISASSHYETGRWDCTVRSSLLWEGPDIQTFGSSLVLLDYYSLWRGKQIVRAIPIWTIGSTFHYREPVSGWNGSLAVSYLKSLSSLTERVIYSDYVLQYPGDDLVPFNRFSVTSTLSKGFFSINGIVKLKIDYSRNASEIRQNHETIKYQSHTFSPRADMNLSLTRWWTTIINISAASTVTNSPGISSLNCFQVSGHMKQTFTLSSSISVGLSADLYHFSEINKTLVLPDVFFRWKHKSGIQVRAEANNLLNDQLFAYKTVSPLLTQEVSYKIRPLEFLLSVEWFF